MTIEQIIRLMNEDLSNEYKHFHFYLHSSFMLRGFERLTFGKWLKDQADEELEHIEQFAKKIISLGGIPTTESKPFSVNLTSPSMILGYAIEMEREVIANFHARLTEVDQYYQRTGARYDLVTFYEEQIQDSQSDVDEMLLW